MRKFLAALLSCAVLISGASSVSAAPKACTDSQLLKIYKLAVEFNDNRSYILKFALNVDRSVAGILKSQGDSDIAAERLWWYAFNTATSEAKRLTVEEKRILKSLKSSFTCSGHGTQLDAKYGFIGVKKNLMAKVWPASVRLTPAPENNMTSTPSALSATEAKNCKELYKNRVYVDASTYVSDNSRVFKMENMSDCLIYFNLSFDVYCPDRSTNFINNQSFPYPVNFKRSYKLEPRKILELRESGFAASVSQECYSVTNRIPNIVKLQNSPPTVQVMGINSSAVDSTPAQSGGKTCVVGGSCPVGSKGPGGGIVFFDAGSKRSWGRYLEMAPPGWSGTEMDPMMAWCDNPASLYSSESEIGKGEIGKGKANTNLMLMKCLTGAAVVAHSYSGGAKSDWFLPSQGELNELCKFARNQATGNANVYCDKAGGLKQGFLEYFYWSSTQGHTSYVHKTLTAWCQDFTYGQQNDFNQRKDEFHVRPIRAF